jgi:phosphoribosyl 1,2-cyclic phosphodiesterase
VVRGGDTFVLVDAGISGRQIRERLDRIGLSPSRLSAVLVTHSHSDHVKGLAAVLKTTDADVYANPSTARESGTDIPEDRLRLFATGETFVIGDLEVTSFPVSHDTADPAGFSFCRGGRQLSIVTDTGTVTQAVMDQIRGADLLVLESNHDENILRMGRYPWFLKQRILGVQGHLSNEAAAKALALALEEERAEGLTRQRTVLLAHLSQENNFPEMALATMSNILEERGLLSAGLNIKALPRTEQSPVYTV